jgi:hypothetical protein
VDNFNDKDRIDQLLNEVVAITKSPQSRPFYLQALEKCGEGMFREEFGELCYLLKTRDGDKTIMDPAKFFTTMLTRLISDLGAGKFVERRSRSCFFDSVGDIMTATEKDENFKEKLENKTEATIRFDSFMDKPYSNMGIPVPTFFGPEYSTLSTDKNKNKSDMVKTTIRFVDGNEYEIPMARGKGFPNDNDWGMLTVEDTEIIKKIVLIWQEDGHKKTSGDHVKCWCQFSIRRLADKLGYQKFGGKNLKDLARRVSRIGGISYYWDFAGLPGFEKEKRKTVTVYFIDKPIVIHSESDKKTDLVFKVTFSEFYSHSLLMRKTVLRSKDNLKQINNKNELAIKIQQYIESRVSNKNDGGEGFKITLANLIKKLFLPKADWHNYKSTRFREFKKALKQLHETTTWDGDSFFASLIETADKIDYMLKVTRGKIIDATDGKDILEIKVRPNLLIAREKVAEYNADPHVENKQKEGDI